MRSAIWNARAGKRRRVWGVCSTVSFCIGATILPAVVVADATALLCCRDPGGAQCRQSMAQSIAESGLAELGTISTMDSVEVEVSIASNNR